LKKVEDVGVEKRQVLDVPDNVSLLARRLQSEGYEYIIATDGREALEKTRSNMPDLILLDVNMPGMNGFRILEEIRRDPAIKHIPLIVLPAARMGYAD
jgi:CheY-like chemotaxis protein